MVKKREPEYAKNGLEISSAGIVANEARLKLREEGLGVPRPLFGYRPMPCLIFYMGRAGIDVSEHRSKRLTARAAQRADLIIAMGNSHREAIVTRYPGIKDRVITLAEVSYPFEFENIVVNEPPGLMPPAKFCMLRCDHWSITESVMGEIWDRLKCGLPRIIEILRG
jgi:protein-tyrosine-phosphatase